MRVRHLSFPVLLVLLGGAGPPARGQSPGEIRALIDRGYPVEAAAAAEGALEKAEREQGADSEAAADLLDLLVEAQIESEAVSRDKTLELAEHAVQLRRAEGSTELFTSLRNLGVVLWRIGDYPESKQFLEEAVEVGESSAGPVPLALTLGEVAVVRTVTRDLEQAGADLARAQTLLDEGGASPAKRADLENAFGMLSYHKRDLSQAEDHYRRALTLREGVLDPGHPALGESCVNLAMVLRRAGNVEQSEELYRRALEINETRLGPNTPSVGASLNGLALLAKSRGEYLEAREMLDRALAIWEAAYGPDHRLVAGALNNLANLNLRLGDNRAAASELERALGIREKTLGPDHPLVAQALSNLAAVLADLERWDEAVTFLRRALRIQEEESGQESQAVVATLTNLGHSLASRGDLPEAEELLRRAVAIIDGGEEGNQAVLMDALANLSLTRLVQGDVEEATSLMERGLDLSERLLGPDNPSTGKVLLLQARVQIGGGDAVDALRTALRVESIGREHLRLLARGFSEREALVYGQARPRGLDLALTLALEVGDQHPELLREVWDSVIRSRGLVLREMAERRRLLSAASQDPAAAEAVAALREAASTVASLVARASGDPSHRAAVENAKKALESAERELAGTLSSESGEKRPEADGLSALGRLLPEGSALVAFVRYRHHDRQAAFVTEPIPSYAAFVRRGEDGATRLIPLGGATEIDLLVDRWRRSAAEVEGDLARYRSAGEALRRRIWDPVVGQVGPAEIVFAVPDGSLHLVNLMSLPSGRTSFLVEEGPLLALLSEERDLFVESVAALGEGSAIFFGDPDFDVASVAKATPSPRFVLRGSPSVCDAYAELRFCSLPATGGEAKALGAVWRESGASPERLTVLTGSAASEGAFRARAPGARVIHLATHGFFLGSSCSAADMVPGGTRGVGGLGPAPSELPTGIDATAPVENPLLLSGVALAGANRRGDGSLGTEDGILSAEEIATLDLSGTEWAVLSACDSGLGTVETGEGVFGLRRAFRVAGARTVIMSLWAVEDDAARQWMEALYRARFQEGLSTAASVRQASRSVLQSRRERGESIHPFYWAGFVAAGDWR